MSHNTPKVPPQITLVPEDPTEVIIGHTVQLACLVYTDPPEAHLSISWSRQGSDLMNDSQQITIYEQNVEEGGITFVKSILQICNFGEGNAGMYRCFAENIAGNDTASFELLVLC